MIRFLYYFLAISVCLILETVLRTAGFCLPLTSFAVFYCAYVAGSLRGFLYACLAGFMLDSVLGCNIPWSMPAFAAIVPLAWLLRDVLESESPLLLIWVGAVLPLIVLLPQLPLRGGWQVTLSLLPSLFLAAILSSVLLPLTVSVLDHFSTRLALPRFDEVKEMKRRERT